MSPRKARYRVPEHLVQRYRDKKQKILRGPYLCPNCNLEGLRISISEEKKKVIAVCKCGFRKNLDYDNKNEGIDYYNMIFDNS